ncbi:flavin-binding monooxygenase-like protein-like protein [Paraphaeosphaeria sporulosa]|uniref:Flavin-binding monooxygenase-like protein-like protein n=1 Tax=Paraphaeosphaeria sporulosa TaxID=1460663 RepID=A0A177CHE7_9PLEO|nr:flavin-binding monooxygenase-like protein-like protein [Paraphaeosphaeria sporulosa]OAG06210.1 flavin-binding monooxygenase-like protein-like protein [Paraphaeosphaeria sporulosa]
MSRANSREMVLKLSSRANRCQCSAAAERLSGIIAAQRFLDAHPKANLAILEKDGDIGGVFSRRRLYDSFWTQWSHGLSEFSDLPMARPPEADCYHDFYRAKYTTDYLHEYCGRKDGRGRTLRDRMIFNVNIDSVKKVDGLWNVCSGGRTFTAPKVLIASGLCSLAKMPSLPGKDRFGGAIVHTEDFGETNIMAAPNITKLVVLGAGKSAADVVYEGAKSGKEVHWVIKTTGTGPSFFASGKGKGPFKNAFEAAHTRFVATLGPSIFNRVNIWTKFVQRNWLGRWLVGKLLAQQDQAIRMEADYQGRDNAKGFDQLEYETPFFWQNGPGGLIHHDDFWETISSCVHIQRDQVRSLDRNLVQLEGGAELACDAIICGTGWIPSLRFFDNEQLLQLGLPMPLEDEPSEVADRWESLLQDGDRHICSRFPLLANPPKHSHRGVSTTTYRLYHGMAPINDDSILFMNHLNTGNKMLAAEVQAMWAVAYFDKQITLPSREDMERSVATWVAFSRRRYLSNGGLGNAINFETITYADALLDDMGLAAHKKSWWQQWFEPFRPSDLGKAWAEYLQKHPPGQSSIEDAGS